MANTLDYYNAAPIMAVKSFIVQAKGQVFSGKSDICLLI
jgi:hypothetical protein